MPCVFPMGRTTSCRTRFTCLPIVLLLWQPIHIHGTCVWSCNWLLRICHMTCLVKFFHVSFSLSHLWNSNAWPCGQVEQVAQDIVLAYLSSITTPLYSLPSSLINSSYSSRVIIGHYLGRPIERILGIPGDHYTRNHYDWHRFQWNLYEA